MARIDPPRAAVESVVAVTSFQPCRVSAADVGDPAVAQPGQAVDDQVEALLVAAAIFPFGGLTVHLEVKAVR